MDLKIFALSFDEPDVIAFYTQVAVVALQIKNIIFPMPVNRILVLKKLPVLVDLFCSPVEILASIWLQEIVQGIHLVALDRIFGICRHEYGHRGILQRPDEVQTIDVRHVYVDIYEVDFIGFQMLPCHFHTMAGGGQFHKRILEEMALQLFQSQWFVIDYHATYIHLSGIVRVTE